MFFHLSLINDLNAALILHFFEEIHHFLLLLYHSNELWYNKRVVVLWNLIFPLNDFFAKGGKRLYHYHNKQNRFGYSAKSGLLQPILFIAVIVILTLLVSRLFGGSVLNVQNFENQRNAKIRSEMQHAVTQTNSLSRLGATSTNGVLAKIRQYIHGIEVLNELNVGMYGEVGRLYQQVKFDEIYAIIDTYEAKLVSGQKVNDSLVLLTEAIEIMSDFTNNTVLEE